jgi:hypothetical protein
MLRGSPLVLRHASSVQTTGDTGVLDALTPLRGVLAAGGYVRYVVISRHERAQWAYTYRAGRPLEGSRHMSSALTLVRPSREAHTALGNDGLTVDERIDYAAAHRAGAGSPVVSSEERAAVAAWLARRGDQ